MQIPLTDHEKRKIEEAQAAVFFISTNPIAYSIRQQIKNNELRFGNSYKPNGVVIHIRLLVSMMEAYKRVNDSSLLIKSDDLFDKRMFIQIGEYKLIVVSTQELNEGEIYIF